MQLPAVRVSQGGVTLYVGKICAGDLLREGVITEWDPNLGWDLENQGYQRAPEEKHYRRIANFLANEGIPLLPTAALLSAREQDYGKLDFKEAISGSDIGYLDFPEGRRIFIVDYQHRWRGFQVAIKEMRKTELESFQVPFVLMAAVNTYEEMRQFYLVNNKQKRVNTDLALALMLTMATEANEQELLNLVGPGNRYKIRATRLTFRIAELSTGTWVKKIQEPNNPQSSDVVNPKSYVDSLRPIISRRSAVYQKSDDDLISIMAQYWEGIKELMTTAFDKPQDYAIQRALGVFVMHRVAAVKVLRDCNAAGDFSSGKVATILRPAATDYLNDSFWRTGGPVRAFSSGSGQKDLAERILSKL